MSWPACNDGPVVARDHDGAVLCQGIPPRNPTSVLLLQPVLAHPGHHLGRHFRPGLPGGNQSMSSESSYDERAGDIAPGYKVDTAEGVRNAIRGYLIGLALATALTVASFWAARTGLIYGPGVPIALVVLAVAQMGIHLVFFLHITT